MPRGAEAWRAGLVVSALLGVLTVAALLVGLLLGGCTCRFSTRPAPANPAGRELVVERCVWGVGELDEKLARSARD